MADNELDVQQLRKPDNRPAFAANDMPRYLTVHRRRQALVLKTPVRQAV